MNKQNHENATRANPNKLIYNLLISLGENPEREGLKETPERVIKMYQEVLSGYKVSPESVFKTFDSQGYTELITAINIEFYSLCEHHMVPFFGKVHIGYIPDGRILGLSKFVRLVEIYSRRLQTQENITNQISKAMDEYLKPLGHIVHIESEHLCVSMRGVRKKGFSTKTTIAKGKLKTNKKLIDQFYRDVARG